MKIKMAIQKHTEKTDTTTEEKIKNAAKKVFHQKGFAATRTRDIAEEAKINLALLNYYFRSKKKLFDIIMLESLQQFLQSMSAIFNDTETDLASKISSLADGYIDLFISEPDVPLFVLSELRNHPTDLISKMNFKEFLLKSHMMKQIQAEIKLGNIPNIHPLHFIMNMMGMIVFPFVASPIIKNIGNMEQTDFDEMMKQRKALIPLWFKAMLNTK